MVLNTSSSVSSRVRRSIILSEPGILYCVGFNAMSRSSFFIFFKDCVMTYARFSKLLKRRLLLEPNPASEQKINSLQPKSRIMVVSRGFKVVYLLNHLNLLLLFWISYYVILIMNYYRSNVELAVSVSMWSWQMLMWS